MYLILHPVLQNINVMFEKYINLFNKVSILVELHTQNSYILFFLCVSLETHFIVRTIKRDVLFDANHIFITK